MSAHLPGQFKILCIEDEPEILRDIADELRDHGFQVEAAPNAIAALQTIEAQAPDLVVCDMQMPGMSGVELLETLRARGDRLSAVPFVFLTAFGDREAMLSGRRAGADDYLVKPIDYDLLIAAVESHLHNAARRHEATRQNTVRTMATSGDDGRTLALAELATMQAGGALAIAKLDRSVDWGRRFGHYDLARFFRVTKRLTTRAGLKAFWQNPTTCAIVGPDAARLTAGLERLASLHLRDHMARSQPALPVRWSIVTGELEEGADHAALLDTLSEAARLVQREGGNRLLALGSEGWHAVSLAASIRAELVKALRQGELHVCFQPKLDCLTAQPVGAEVLVRWESPVLGHLSPATFIPILERAGLLPYVTDWVLAEAAKAQVALAAAGLPTALAVNIGADEFNAELPLRIGRIFAQHGASPRLLEVEITETSMLANPDGANGNVRALHAQGIRVALDDFGTGYSSLRHLQACVVDAIKIDRSFVRGLGVHETDRSIVLAVIEIARNLGIQTIAEGVETSEQLAFLRENGCDLVQGYLLGRPMPMGDYIAFLRRDGVGAGAGKGNRTPLASLEG